MGVGVFLGTLFLVRHCSFASFVVRSDLLSRDKVAMLLFAASSFLEVRHAASLPIDNRWRQSHRAPHRKTNEQLSFLRCFASAR
jgi:hypothetical protein